MATVWEKPFVAAVTGRGPRLHSVAGSKASITSPEDRDNLMVNRPKPGHCPDRRARLLKVMCKDKTQSMENICLNRVAQQVWQMLRL